MSAEGLSEFTLVFCFGSTLRFHFGTTIPSNFLGAHMAQQGLWNFMIGIFLLDEQKQSLPLKDVEIESTWSATTYTYNII